MFLAAKLLVRHVADVVALIASASHCLPENVFDRERLQRGDMDPQMRTFLKDFFMSAPRLRASLPSTGRRTNTGVRPSVKKQGTMRLSLVESKTSQSLAQSAELPRKLLSASQSDPQSVDLDKLDGEPGTTSLTSKPAPPMSRLNEAMGALDQVVVFHLTELTSDMHRQMYWAFVRMCQFYVRWKRAFENERARCRQKSVKRHSGRKLDNRDSLDSPKTRGMPKMGRRFSQQPRTQRTGSLAVPGQAPSAPSAAPPSSTPQESGGGKSALRGRKQLGRSKTTALAQPIQLPTGHVGFADTDEVRTFRGSQESEVGLESQTSVILERDDEDASRSMTLFEESHKKPLASFIEDDKLDGLD
jgi:hypothetical protein